MVRDSFSTLQHPGEAELWAGWVLIFFLWSILSPTWALFSSHTDLLPLLRVPLRVLSGLLFLLLLLFLLRVCISFPLPVLSQLERKKRNHIQSFCSAVTNNISKRPWKWRSAQRGFNSLFICLSTTSRPKSEIGLSKSLLQHLCTLT